MKKRMAFITVPTLEELYTAIKGLAPQVALKLRLDLDGNVPALIIDADDATLSKLLVESFKFSTHPDSGYSSKFLSYSDRGSGQIIFPFTLDATNEFIENVVLFQEQLHSANTGKRLLDAINPGITFQLVAPLNEHYVQHVFSASQCNDFIRYIQKSTPEQCTSLDSSNPKTRFVINDRDPDNLELLTKEPYDTTLRGLYMEFIKQKEAPSKPSTDDLQSVVVETASDIVHLSLS
jgi:hypothetical protein